MIKREIDWQRIMKSLEYHLDNYLNNPSLKEAGKEGIRAEITIYKELSEAVWGTGIHQTYAADDFKLFVESDARKAIEFAKSKLEE